MSLKFTWDLHRSILLILSFNGVSKPWPLGVLCTSRFHSPLFSSKWIVLPAMEVWGPCIYLSKVLIKTVRTAMCPLMLCCHYRLPRYTNISDHLEFRLFHRGHAPRRMCLSTWFNPSQWTLCFVISFLACYYCAHICSCPAVVFPSVCGKLFVALSWKQRCFS